MENLIFSVFPDEHFLDLNLLQSGWEQCPPSKSFGPAIRNHWLFHYIISGQGQLNATDHQGINHTYQLHEGQGFLIFPGQVCTYIADAQNPWEYVWVEFSGLKAKSIIDASGLSMDAPIYKSRTAEARADLQHVLIQIAQGKQSSMLRLLANLYSALDIIDASSISKQEIKKSGLRDFYIHEAIHFIEQNYQTPITIEDIASVCGLNRSYFGKVFKNTIGKTPQEFLLEYRMTKASELLQATQYSIGDIGKAVGYDNPLHFSRAFKNVYGISPRNWRETQVNNKHTITTIPAADPACTPMPGPIE